MKHSIRSRLRPLRYVVVVSVAALAALLLGTALASADTAWNGVNGAEGGFCNQVSEDASVPPGMQQWLFILTPAQGGVITGAPGTLTAEFANSPDAQATGDQQGNGSVHYTVFSGIGDQLISAVTTATGNNLVVSHCETGPPGPPPGGGPPPEEVTPPPGEVTPPEGGVTPAAGPTAAVPTPVRAAARFTG